MSTYVTRFVEIKNRETGKWELVKWLTKKSQSDPQEGQEIREVNGEEMVVNDHFVDSAFGIRDYLRDVWEYMGTHFKDRGVPDDASEELKAAFAEHTKPGEDGQQWTYNHSYYLLSELEELSEKEVDFGWKSIEREVNAIGESDIKALLRTVISNQALIAGMRPEAGGASVAERIKESVPKKPENSEGTDGNDILRYVRETYYEIVDSIQGVQREVNNIYNIVFNCLGTYKLSEEVRVTFYFD